MKGGESCTWPVHTCVERPGVCVDKRVSMGGLHGNQVEWENRGVASSIRNVRFNVLLFTITKS